VFCDGASEATFEAESFQAETFEGASEATFEAESFQAETFEAESRTASRYAR
jgi:hypothetical protein